MGNIGPRAGFAYQVRQGTVLRGSYGLFYLPTTGVYIRLAGTGFASQTAYVASTDGGLTPAGSLSHPFPQGIVEPSGSSLGLLTGLGTNIVGDQRSLKRGRSQQWDVDVQQQLPGNWVLVLGYLGNRGRDLPAGVTYNYLPESALELGPALQELVPNPYAGIITAGTLAQPRVPRGTLLMTYPQFTGATGLGNWASSDYHAGTVRLERRMTDGLSMLVSYIDRRDGAMDEPVSAGGARIPGTPCNSRPPRASWLVRRRDEVPPNESTRWHVKAVESKGFRRAALRRLSFATRRLAAHISRRWSTCRVRPRPLPM